MFIENPSNSMVANVIGLTLVRCNANLILPSENMHDLFIDVTIQTDDSRTNSPLPQ